MALCEEWQTGDRDENRLRALYVVFLSAMHAPIPLVGARATHTAGRSDQSLALAAINAYKQPKKRSAVRDAQSSGVLLPQG